MNVKELIEKLKKCAPETKVVIPVHDSFKISEGSFTMDFLPQNKQEPCYGDQVELEDLKQIKEYGVIKVLCIH